MTPSRTGIALGCTTCQVDVVVESQEEDEVRAALAGFFAAHEGCHVTMDISRHARPLPRKSA